MKTMRKGAKVRYIGDSEIAKGKTFSVLHKYHNLIEIMFPLVYLDGEVHYDKQYRLMSEFELVEG